MIVVNNDYQQVLAAILLNYYRKSIVSQVKLTNETVMTCQSNIQDNDSKFNTKVQLQIIVNQKTLLAIATKTSQINIKATFFLEFG